MAASYIQIRPDPELYVRDPEGTELGRSILLDGLIVMDELGLEAFTFKKLAKRIGCTEVSIYNYFPNKHRLLQYYFQLYWLWLRQLCGRHAEKEVDPRIALEKLVETICGVWTEEVPVLPLDAKLLRKLVIEEGMKSYLHKNVDADNAKRLFLPYKELSAFVAERLQACRGDIPMPRSFATTLIEMAHSLPFAMEHLPSLTELSDQKSLRHVAQHLKHRTLTYLDHAKPFDEDGSNDHSR